MLRSKKKFLNGYTKGLNFGLKIGERRKEEQILIGLRENLKLKRNGRYRDGYEQALLDVANGDLPRVTTEEEWEDDI